MKVYGWIVVKILDFSKKNITFYVSESEPTFGEPKFPQLLKKVVTYVRKKKIRNSTIVKDDKFSVNFISIDSEFIPEKGCEYALLINTTPFTPMEIWKAGLKSDLYKALGIPYSTCEVDAVYKVSIPSIEGTVTDRLPEIIKRLKLHFPGDPLMYLVDDKNTWFIKAFDGEFKETIMPVLPEKVV